MRKGVIPLLTLCLLALGSHPALAGSPEAREVARLNNCTPKKITVAQERLGAVGSTTYQVTCTLSKKDGEGAAGPDALLIRCDGSLCSLLRPIKSAQN